MRDHVSIFVPRTLYLSHWEQNEDIVHFSEFKRMDLRERQAIQTVLITADWRNLARRSHGERTLGIHQMQQCTARPWEKVFAERLFIQAWEKGGYYPFTRLPMAMLAREQISAKFHVQVLLLICP